MRVNVDKRIIANEKRKVEYKVRKDRFVNNKKKRGRRG